MFASRQAPMVPDAYTNPSPTFLPMLIPDTTMSGRSSQQVVQPEIHAVRRRAG